MSPKSGPIVADLIAVGAARCRRALLLLPVIASLLPVPGTAASASYHRIVSLAPSVTETLYALGLGDRVVGVTRYCVYPPDARRKPNVGGFLDPNYEEILRLRPDLVVAFPEQEAVRSYLRGMGIAVLPVKHKSIDDIVGSIAVIGNACGAGKRGDSLATLIRARIGRIRAATAGKPRPRVLVSVGRSMGSLTDLCVAGGDTYYAEMVALAGGENALSGGGIAFPMVSLEGVCRINPQVVIDMIPQGSAGSATPQAVLAQWKKAGNIDAVRNGRVYLFTQEFAETPGPRFIDVLERMARVIHPELRE